MQEMCKKNGCCGMSLKLNYKTNYEDIIIPNIIIDNNKFIILCLIVFIISLLVEFLKSYIWKLQKTIRKQKLKAFYSLILSIVVFFISWCIMMISMTSNVFIVLSFLMGKSIGSTIVGLRAEYNELDDSCC
ncbi:hypothetical protein TCON_1431 [Astathelohania contejeani]|uniref:Copper transporter n=1 Tax=Astathelohania contejeani TaxID=164912 RepID=A0ABQ7HYT2_9MICR|nr:hypothetical protein TCON_1431 [Thelohania contejeani]